jgi:hypothetical protein
MSGKFQDWLVRQGLEKLKFTVGFLDMEFKPTDQDKDAAWELYIELLTRITTQSLAPQHGDEGAALASVFKLFELTRGILRAPGRRGAREFTKVAIVVLNQVVRPFTAEWHKRSLAGDFQKSEHCEEFRQKLAVLQAQLVVYSRALADMAGVEDLTRLEAE